MRQKNNAQEFTNCTSQYTEIKILPEKHTIKQNLSIQVQKGNKTGKVLFYSFSD